MSKLSGTAKNKWFEVLSESFIRDRYLVLRVHENLVSKVYRSWDRLQRASVLSVFLKDAFLKVLHFTACRLYYRVSFVSDATTRISMLNLLQCATLSKEMTQGME